MGQMKTTYKSSWNCANTYISSSNGSFSWKNSSIVYWNSFPGGGFPQLNFPCPASISGIRELKSNRRSFLASIKNSSVAMSGDSDGSDVEDGKRGVAKGSGTKARGRRLLKLKEEKRKREYDRLHNYPAWAKVLEEACKNDAELRAVIGDSVGNPELMRKKVEERVRKKGRDFHKPKTGSIVAFKVSFRDFNPVDSYIWLELYGSPSDQDVELIGSVIQAWYVMGRLGAFNSSNLQVTNSSMEYNPLYDVDKGFKVLPSSFHDISDVEFQDNWGRFWVDLGTSDYFAIDVLLNCLTVLSSEYLGIKQVVFGGHHIVKQSWLEIFDLRCIFFIALVGGHMPHEQKQLKYYSVDIKWGFLLL
ncbi:hypothetical protein Nepgr_012721 [Nepenthes gracilis]|uniref:DUF3531 domain-containing protein n=1 Tax=Nepenthes gracilis TaxID=150966 RepID=A0AAD3SG98_NEPGR|nr:hypothetical protein Nepgr_012721 [Nepenthes gracilis]